LYTTFNLAVQGGKGQNFKKITKLDRQYLTTAILPAPLLFILHCVPLNGEKSIAAFAVVYLIIAMGIIIFKHAE
jgi:hypothetical protein